MSHPACTRCPRHQPGWQPRWTREEMGGRGRVDWDGGGVGWIGMGGWDGGGMGWIGMGEGVRWIGTGGGVGWNRGEEKGRK